MLTDSHEQMLAMLLAKIGDIASDAADEILYLVVRTLFPSTAGVCHELLESQAHDIGALESERLSYGREFLVQFVRNTDGKLSFHGLPRVKGLQCRVMQCIAKGQVNIKRVQTPITSTDVFVPPWTAYCGAVSAVVLILMMRPPSRMHRAASRTHESISVQIQSPQERVAELEAEKLLQHQREHREQYL
jgi:hypothetical protein